jgi:hypothetical protein
MRSTVRRCAARFCLSLLRFPVTPCCVDDGRDTLLTLLFSKTPPNPPPRTHTKRPAAAGAPRARTARRHVPAQARQPPADQRGRGAVSPRGARHGPVRLFFRHSGAWLLPLCRHCLCRCSCLLLALDVVLLFCFVDQNHHNTTTPTTKHNQKS